MKYLNSFILQVAASCELSGAVIGLSHMEEISTNSFSIDQEFEGSGGGGDRDYTGFTFTSLSSTSFQFDGSFLDEGTSVFFVAADEEFSEAKILEGSFAELTLWDVYELPQFFFLGVRTPALGVDFGPYDPAYGWGLFQNLGGVLSLVDHAVAYDANGIVVNTQAAIHKPAPVSISSVSYSNQELHLEFTGPSGLTTSALVGSGDLLLFDIELEPHTTLAEVTPQNYRAMINTASFGGALFVKIDSNR